MISKNLYLNLLVRVLLIVVLSVISGYLIADGTLPRLFLICFVVIVILTVNLITFLNSTNKKIRYFFDSVKNDESNLFFPTEEKNITVREIYRNMNKVNEQIQKLKIENRNQEQYFQTLIEHLAIGIITFNKQGFILHSNSSARKLMETDVLTHIKQLERIDIKLYQTVNSIKPSERKLVPLNTERGEIQLSLKAASLRTNNDEFLILSVQDIKNELDEKEVESWMKLIRILMHEIMNSITPITSLSESLSHIYSSEGQPVLPGQITSKTIATTLQGLNVIKDQGRGLMSFVESYRKLTHIPVPDKKLFRVSDLFNRLQILYNSEEKNNKAEVSFAIKDPDIVIFADINLISQVLINLVKNAFEAVENSPEGRIIISAGTSPDQRVEIYVSDNGPGIPAENLDEIFVPFFTTRQNGSGIGLSLSRQIMRVHGGNLRVMSAPGSETTFCLTFNRI
jgi:two-component system, NtrC family, nitrogen regulation sensor histidine kinase NtrY